MPSFKPFADENAIFKTAQKASRGVVLPSRSTNVTPAIRKTSALGSSITALTHFLSSKFSKGALLYILICAMFFIASKGERPLPSNPSDESLQTVDPSLSAPQTPLYTLGSFFYSPFRVMSEVHNQQEARNDEVRALRAGMGQGRADTIRQKNLDDLEVKKYGEIKAIDIQFFSDQADIEIEKNAGIQLNEAIKNACNTEYNAYLDDIKATSALDRGGANLFGGVAYTAGSVVKNEGWKNWGNKLQTDVNDKLRFRRESARTMEDCAKSHRSLVDQ